MLYPASRAVFRRSHVLVGRLSTRHNSATSQAAHAASEAASTASATASTAASKASEGLSRVSSSAGPVLTRVARGATDALKRIGGRTGRVVAVVESMIPPTIYYTKVGYELAKIVFRSQRMSPPSLATIQSFYQPLLEMAKRPSDLATHLTNASSKLHPFSILNRVRNISMQEMAVAGVVGAELLGFFTIGEIIGRFKLVGYRVEQEEHH